MALKLKGSTSGFVAVDCAAEGGNNTLILPDSNGVAGAVWANNVDTAGVATCTSVTINKNGDLTVPGTVSVGGTITYEDVTNVDSVGIITARSGVYFGATGSGTLVQGDASGIGINTDSPVYQIDISNTSGGADTSIRLLNVGTASTNDTVFRSQINGTTANNYIYFGDAADTNAGQIVYSHSTDAMRFFTNGNNERLRISSAGKVLIGSDTLRNIGGAGSNGQVQIEGTSTNLSSLAIINNQNNTNASQLNFGKSRGTSVGAATSVADGDNLGMIRWSGADGTDLENATAVIKAVVNGSVSGNTIPTDILFQTSATSGAARAERLRIQSGGNVGINTNNPSDKLGITPASNNQGITLKHTGEIYPALTFDVNRTGTDQFLGNIRGMWNGTTVANIILETGSDTTNKDDGVITFRTASAGSPAERLRINSAGLVGIGIAAPTEKLHVIGQVGGTNPTAGSKWDIARFVAHDYSATNSGGLTIGAYWNNSDADLRTSYIQSSQNTNSGSTVRALLLNPDGGGVGIGTDDATSKLQVQEGDIKIANHGTSDGLFMRNATSTYAWDYPGDENSNIPDGAIGMIITNSDVTTNKTAALLEFRTYRNSATANPGGVYIGAVDAGEGATHSSDMIFALKDGSATVTERMRIMHDGNIVIGHNHSVDVASSAAAMLQVEHAASNISIACYSTVDAVGPAGVLALGHGRGSVSGILQDEDVIGQIRFAGSDGADLETQGAAITAEVDGTPSSNDIPAALVFNTNAGALTTTERMRIHADGTFCVGTANKSIYNDNGSASQGIVMNSAYYTQCARLDGTPLFINRMSGDGALLWFGESGAKVGDITVSGNTVSYNAFLGSHKGRLSDGSKSTILPGTIVENINQTIEWKTATISNVGSASSTVVIPYYGVKTSGTDTVSYGGASYTGTVGFSSNYQPKGDNKHVCVKVSDTASSKAVAGVFVSWDDSINDAKDNGLDEPYNDLRVGGVGNYFIRIKSGETIANGDLVESNGDGTGKVQSDDIIRSKTVGKITNTNVIKTYSDGSFLVTAVLYAG